MASEIYDNAKFMLDQFLAQAKMSGSAVGNSSLRATIDVESRSVPPKRDAGGLTGRDAAGDTASDANAR
jgi:hypothetical protein